MAKDRENLTLSAETLSGINLFRQFDTATRTQIAEHCQLFCFQPNQAIVSYNDLSRDVFFIVSGQVKAIIFSLSGKQVTLQDLDVGEMFGEIAAIDGKPRSAHVIADSEAYVVAIDGEQFSQLLMQYPAMASATLKRMASMVRSLSERVFEISTLSVKQRVQAELLRLALASSQNMNTAIIAPIPKHGDIANHIGTHREAVSREFTRLNEQGLLKRDQHTLIVHDISRLAKMVHTPAQET